MYGLYETRVCEHHDDFGTDESTTLLGTDMSPRLLLRRWNTWAAAHNKTHTYKYPQMIMGSRKMRYYGNTGGGYARVEVILEIKEVPQWDK